MTLRPWATRSRVALKTRSISGLLRVAVGSSRISRRAVADEQARDLDELPLADRKGLDRGSELHVAEAELVEDAASLLGQSRRLR